DVIIDSIKADCLTDFSSRSERYAAKWACSARVKSRVRRVLQVPNSSEVAVPNTGLVTLICTDGRIAITHVEDGAGGKVRNLYPIDHLTIGGIIGLSFPGHLVRCAIGVA